MSKDIKPMKWRTPLKLESIELDGRLQGLQEQMKSVVRVVANMVDSLGRDDFMHLNLNVDAIREGLDELEKMFGRYRQIQKEKK